MKGRSKRLPVAEQIRKGLEESIRRAEGEVTLKTTVLDLPDRPPEIGADELTRLRLIQVFRHDPSGVLRVAGLTGVQVEAPQARQESKGVARKGRTSRSKAKKQTV